MKTLSNDKISTGLGDNSYFAFKTTDSNPNTSLKQSKRVKAI